MKRSGVEQAKLNVYAKEHKMYLGEHALTEFCTWHTVHINDALVLYVKPSVSFS